MLALTRVASSSTAPCACGTTISSRVLGSRSSTSWLTGSLKRGDQAQYRKGEEQDGRVNQHHQLGQWHQGGEAEVGDGHGDQGHTRYGVTQLGDQAVDLAAWQLPALARLGALRNLDLQHFGVRPGRLRIALAGGGRVLWGQLKAMLV